jgi:hypothetical protein
MMGMTVAQLIEELRKQDQSKPVLITSRDDGPGHFEADIVTNEGGYVLIDSR